MIYPDNANVTEYSYTSNTLATNLLTAKTGINGVGNSYTYDNAGRLWLIRDQFDNIVEMKKYRLTNRHPQQIPSVFISYPYETVYQSASTFSAFPPISYETGDCDAPSILYTWDFGDGSPVVTSMSQPNTRGNTSINHTYGATGEYQVSVTASSPGINNVSAQTPPVNSTSPPPVKVVATAPPCAPSGTPGICASGIVQRTSTGQCIQSSCSGLPNTCAETYFKLNNIAGGLVFTVEWQKAMLYSSTWSTYQAAMGGSGGFITSVPFHPIHTDSYQMRAKVIFCHPSGSTIAYSNPITVLNGD
jgi:hypothetical protein